jgi:hypothetical protein
MPPIFLVTYTSTRESHDITYETEWITPGNFDCDRARKAFEREFPSTAVVRVQEVD